MRSGRILKLGVLAVLVLMAPGYSAGHRGARDFEGIYYQATHRGVSKVKLKYWATKGTKNDVTEKTIDLPRNRQIVWRPLDPGWRMREVWVTPLTSARRAVHVTTKFGSARRTMQFITLITIPFGGAAITVDMTRYHPRPRRHPLALTTDEKGDEKGDKKEQETEQKKVGILQVGFSGFHYAEDNPSADRSPTDFYVKYKLYFVQNGQQETAWITHDDNDAEPGTYVTDNSPDVQDVYRVEVHTFRMVDGEETESLPRVDYSHSPEPGQWIEHIWIRTDAFGQTRVADVMPPKQP